MTKEKKEELMNLAYEKHQKNLREKLETNVSDY